MVLEMRRKSPSTKAYSLPALHCITLPFLPLRSMDTIHVRTGWCPAHEPLSRQISGCLRWQGVRLPFPRFSSTHLMSTASCRRRSRWQKSCASTDCWEGLSVPRGLSPIHLPPCLNLPEPKPLPFLLARRYQIIGSIDRLVSKSHKTRPEKSCGTFTESHLRLLDCGQRSCALNGRHAVLRRWCAGLPRAGLTREPSILHPCSYYHFIICSILVGWCFSLQSTVGRRE